MMKYMDGYCIKESVLIGCLLKIPAEKHSPSNAGSSAFSMPEPAGRFFAGRCLSAAGVSCNLGFCDARRTRRHCASARLPAEHIWFCAAPGSFYSQYLHATLRMGKISRLMMGIRFPILVRLGNATSRPCFLAFCRLRVSHPRLWACRARGATAADRRHAGRVIC